MAPGAPAHESAPRPAALAICRNKHWRYISSFHGPWLQLAPDVLERLAHRNLAAPRPRPIDPAVFYDLAKIRKAVDEAAHLAVRAALHHSLPPAPHGPRPGPSQPSRERRHRMRELATAKLSLAYHLDDIAASVATMQSASALDDVARLVLQRDPASLDAAYVHFFHEKIPSRTMAESTPLDALDRLVADRPHDAGPLRTRALTRIFKHDLAAAAADLSDALSTARCLMARHRAARDQPVLARPCPGHHACDGRQDDDQPSSLETQLVFHRAGVYFTIACQHVHAALDGLRDAAAAKAPSQAQREAGQPVAPESPQESQGNRLRAEARKQVRQNAKRAVRDYTAFLSHFDYTPGIAADLADECLPRLGGSATNRQNYPSNSASDRANPNMNRLLESSPTSDALVPHRRPPCQASDRSTWPKLPPPEIHAVSSLFSPLPPPSLPPYPPPPSSTPVPAAATAFAESRESITYHPLLTDALHSLLLCHALVQTPPKEHLRHAHNAARLARICDGYPIFLAARSPARADWTEVLRRAGNWIGLTTSWDNLCRPAPLPGLAKSSTAPDVAKPGANGTAPTPETEAQKRDRQQHEAILEALADERVVDEDSFQRAVRARERRFREDELAAQGLDSASSASSSPPPLPKRWAQDEGREYPITTERAEAIARWVREAPAVVEGGGKKRKGRKAGGKSGLGCFAEDGETVAGG